MSEQEQENNTPQPQNPFDQQNNKPVKKRRFNIYWIYGILAAAIILAQFFFSDSPQQKKVDLGELIEMLQKGEVEKIEVVNKENASIFLNEKGKSSHPDMENNPNAEFSYAIGSLDRFEQAVQDAQSEQSNPVYITYIKKSSWGLEIISWVLPLVLLMLFWVFILRRMSPGGGGQIFNIGKSKAQHKSIIIGCLVSGRPRMDNFVRLIGSLAR